MKAKTWLCVAAIAMWLGAFGTASAAEAIGNNSDMPAVLAALPDSALPLSDGDCAEIRGDAFPVVAVAAIVVKFAVKYKVGAVLLAKVTPLIKASVAKLSTAKTAKDVISTIKLFDKIMTAKDLTDMGNEILRTIKASK